MRDNRRVGDSPDFEPHDSTPSRRAPRTDGDGDARARIGKVIAGKYRIESLVGSGGMAHVYRATNIAIGRTVALKLLRSEQTKSAEVVKRFLREAQTANLISHPNVIDVIDLGHDSDGSPFIVQEFLSGE